MDLDKAEQTVREIQDYLNSVQEERDISFIKSSLRSLDKVLNFVVPLLKELPPGKNPQRTRVVNLHRKALEIQVTLITILQDAEFRSKTA